MSGGLKRTWDALWGRGDFAVTVPSMDGALRPNALLDEAQTLAEAPGVDAMAAHDGALYVTSGPTLTLIERQGTAARTIATFAAPISALAVSASGRLAIGLDDGTLLLRNDPTSDADEALDLPVGNGSVTALAFAPDEALLACIGSTEHRASDWRRDLMTLGRSGAVYRLPPDGGKAELVARDLAFPSGVAIDADGGIIVAEAFRHRLVRLGTKAQDPVLWDIPGYPGRISPASDGGYWLCVFAPRSQMIEFVLRETVYRERMVAEVPEDFWMAPSLRAGRSFKEPLQGGSVKHLGIHKPWGPTRSYGLVVRLDAGFQPIMSYHSRSDGHRHGVTDAADWNGGTVVASKGDEVVVLLEESAPAVQS